jgi:hypothetical protein
MQDSADHHQVIERLGSQQVAGGLDRDAAAGANRLAAAGHYRPVYVQRPAAIAFVGREPQVIDEYSES